MGFLMTLGRVLIASVIFISAWHHLEKPSSFLTFYTNSYDLVYGLASQVPEVASYLPSPSQMASNWLTIIKLVGIFELTIGILFIYGDRLGSILALVDKLIAVVFAHYTVVKTGLNILPENYIELTNILILTGIVLATIGIYNEPCHPVETIKEKVKETKQKIVHSEKAEAKPKQESKGDKKKGKK